MKEVRTFIKTASLTELEKAQELINDAISKFIQQQKSKQEVLDLLKEKGLTLEDLQDAYQDKRTKVKPKYRIKRKGEIFEWAGRGRRPKAFEGVELDKYLVD